MCTPIRLIQITNTMITNHDKSVYIVILYTWSTDNPEIMFILLLYSMILCWGYPTVMQPCIFYNYVIFVTTYWRNKRYCVFLLNVRGTFTPRPPQTRSRLIGYCDVIMWKCCHCLPLTVQLGLMQVAGFTKIFNWKTSRIKRNVWYNCLLVF